MAKGYYFIFDSLQKSHTHTRIIINISTNCDPLSFRFWRHQFVLNAKCRRRRAIKIFQMRWTPISGWRWRWCTLTLTLPIRIENEKSRNDYSDKRIWILDSNRTPLRVDVELSFDQHQLTDWRNDSSQATSHRYSEEMDAFPAECVSVCVCVCVCASAVRAEQTTCIPEYLTIPLACVSNECLNTLLNANRYVW